MREYKKLWLLLIAVLVVTFGVLGWSGVEIYRQVPPIPAQVVTTSGKQLMTEEQILDGQTAWQSTGGMQIGSIWGHGAYQAPDWSADWLHRELLAWLDLAAQELAGVPYDQLDSREQAYLRDELKREYRSNTLNPETLVVTVTDRRAQAIEQVSGYYEKLYGADPELRGSRESFAMKEDTLPSAERRADLTKFFFWTAWAAATERPGSDVTYTNNWPHEPLIDNKPSTNNVIWSVISVVLLLAGIAFLVWGWAFTHREVPEPEAPKKDPLLAAGLTPSQRALGKYLLMVVGLFIFQILLGGFTAHYTVEGQTFYGIDVSQWFPYSLTRTWHLQTALFWIAAGFLAGGLFLVPLINGGKDPKYQKLGVDILFWALIVLVVGSYIGNYLAIAQVMPAHLNFWLGHQGYEYLELGRFWQIVKFLGLAFWLLLMLRGILPAFKNKGTDKNLLALLTFSIVAVGLF
ncbi:MAG: nitric-oxide reductase large subunit, partial [Alcaligenaceae bacterium]|nr:nitric-oxide reductase large subunit [Alcaligenaceae bacterium]